MKKVVLDLSALDAEDLRALHLGGQVMRHRANLAARPQVAAFFAALASVVDDELARRTRALDPWGGSIALTFGDPSDRPDESSEDRRLVAEYLTLLGGNPRLSTAVRTTCASLGDQLVGAH